jgi:BTB And C-terminal Kelch
LELETKEALASQDWLSISSKSILEFLNMDCLNIKEADLLRALIKWGKFQMRQSEDDAIENLRNKILPGLQKIRFGSFTQVEAAKMCDEVLGEVLTAEEKYSILNSFIRGDWKMMPIGVVSSSKLTPRRGPNERYTFCAIFFDEIPAPFAQNLTKGPWTFDFQINKKADVVGVKLNLPAWLNVTLASITLHNFLNGKYVVSSTADPKSAYLCRVEKFYRITSPQTLTADTKYTMSFTFTPSKGEIPPGKNDSHKAYTLPKDRNPSCSDGLKLTVLNAHQNFYVHIQGVVFGKICL